MRIANSFPRYRIGSTEAALVSRNGPSQKEEGDDATGVPHATMHRPSRLVADNLLTNCLVIGGRQSLVASRFPVRRNESLMCEVLCTIAEQYAPSGIWLGRAFLRPSCLDMILPFTVFNAPCYPKACLAVQPMTKERSSPY